VLFLVLVTVRPYHHPYRLALADSDILPKLLNCPEPAVHPFISFRPTSEPPMSFDPFPLIQMSPRKQITVFELILNVQKQFESSARYSSDACARKRTTFPGDPRLAQSPTKLESHPPAHTAELSLQNKCHVNSEPPDKRLPPPAPSEGPAAGTGGPSGPRPQQPANPPESPRTAPALLISLGQRRNHSSSMSCPAGACLSFEEARHTKPIRVHADLPG
jgi:hypothetical protein